MTSAVSDLSSRLDGAIRLHGARHDADPAVSPWAIWVLFGLVRHQWRQRWVGNIAVSRLGADLSAISRSGWVGHPDSPASNLVPGHTDWEFHFHGRGCCLTNRLSGQTIDVDFYDGSADWFDDFFYCDFLKSLKDPDFVEQRIISLHPTIETVRLSLDELVDVGLLFRRPGYKVVRLAEDCSEWGDRVDKLDAAGSQGLSDCSGRRASGRRC
jgi:hypothetical protein